MIKQGKVVSVGFDVDVKKKDGGSYPAWQLIYSVDGKVESIQKHMNGLKFKAGLRESLASLGAGDDVSIELEKKGDFWEVENITKGHVGASVAATTIAKVAGSDYETKEERAIKQRLIVRQSSLTTALTFFELVGNKKVTEGEVMSLADQFTDFVFENNADKQVEVK